jgi:3',5'-cyclic AMP phosphodiesterase CpdA
MTGGPTYVVGDVHGCVNQTVALLVHAGLISDALTWTGGDATLWFTGDFTDRGPHGLAAIDLAMWLQREAEAGGGRVDALLGNHDLLIVAARRFGGGFLADWRRNGGVTADLKRLSMRHANWLTARPAVAIAGDHLLIHADATFYELLGPTAESVNATLAAILNDGNPDDWDHLLGLFSERRAFDDSTPGGVDRAQTFLRQYGGTRIVHGHTPINYVNGANPPDIVEPYVYAEGLCVNVDGAMYLGGPGVIYKIESAP